jgi:hypothetical protein
LETRGIVLSFQIHYYLLRKFKSEQQRSPYASQVIDEPIIVIYAPRFNPAEALFYFGLED